MNITVVYLGHVKKQFFRKNLCRAHEIITRVHDILSRAHVWAYGRSVATVIQTTISCMRGQRPTKRGTSAAMHVLEDHAVQILCLEYFILK